MRRLMMFILANILILSACASTMSGTPSTPTNGLEFTPTLAQGEIPTMTPFPSIPSGPGLQNLTEKAKEDLAQRLSIPSSQIDVLEARDVIWSNSSLGCPQPGMLYAEVLTPGYLILLNADGQEYEYHAGRNSDVFLCENPIPPIPGTLEDV